MNIFPGYACGYNINSLLAVPVKEGPVISGVLIVDSERINAFNDKDLELTERFARVISTMLTRQKISLHKEREERSMRLLHSLTANLTTTIKPEDLISTILKGCHTLLPSSAVGFIERKGKGFVLKDFIIPEDIDGKGNTSEITLHLKPNFIASNPFYSLISEEKKFLYIPKVKPDDFSYLPFYIKNSGSLVVLPLWYKHKLMACWSFLLKQRRPIKLNSLKSSGSMPLRLLLP